MGLVTVVYHLDKCV